MAEREQFSWRASLSRRQRRRDRGVGPKSLSSRPSKEELAELKAVKKDGKRRLPITRSECRDGARPCPLVSCRHHLYLDVSPSGNVRLNFPDILPEQMLVSCSLDLADEGPLTLDQVGQVMNLTRERVRQLENLAKARMADLLRLAGIDGPGIDAEVFSAWEILYP